VISDFPHKVVENCTLLGHYAASSDMTVLHDSPEQHNCQVTVGGRKLYNVTLYLNFYIFSSCIRPDDGLKPEPKLVASKIILTVFCM
jgi:hypothetical protein